MNTKINYLYCDGGNYKRRQEAIVAGIFTKDDRVIIQNALDDGLWFIPEQIGLSCDRFSEYETDEYDHCFCELEIDNDFEETEDPPTVDMTAEDITKAFSLALANGWDVVKYAIIF